MKIKDLTRAELEIMQVLWDLGSGHVCDVLDRLPAPKPAYNTVSTIIRILEKKGFVGHRARGRSFEYYPLVLRDEYTRGFMSGVINQFFGGSLSHLVSFFASEKGISVEEADAILKMLSQNDRS